MVLKKNFMSLLRMQNKQSVLFLIIFLCASILSPLTWAGNTVYVVDSLQHESLLPTRSVDQDSTKSMTDREKNEYLSNTYLDLGVRWDYSSNNKAGFRGMEAALRGELMEWPLLGFEAGFKGYGLSHLHISSQFDWGKITIGDVYGQFGSGLILRLYEERSLGIDNALRGAKIELTPYTGIRMELLGGKQRRYWNCYTDGAGGWNYTQDAALGANLELQVSDWSEVMRNAGANLLIGGSYVSKYEAFDTIMSPDNPTLMYNVPEWVGAGDVRAKFQMKGWNALVEYAYKANDPCFDNNMSYKPGQTLLASLSYSQKGMSVIAQVKRSENMFFRSDRQLRGIAGYLNHLPAFANQHTYALAALYPYATQMAGEWAFQGEIRYTWKRGTKMGGKYGTTLKLNASHVRGLQETNTWLASKETYYTDVNLELNKKINKKWYIGAMLMYQTYNKAVVEGDGDLIRSGIGVVEGKYAVNKNIQMRAELQYLFTKQDEGQWIFALYELSLWKQLMISGQWMYNIGYAPKASNEHYYTAGATYVKGAHRVMLSYTKTREGFNCSGGVCRLVPKQEGVNITYNFTW